MDNRDISTYRIYYTDTAKPEQGEQFSCIIRGTETYIKQWCAQMEHDFPTYVSRYEKVEEAKK